MGTQGSVLSGRTRGWLMVALVGYAAFLAVILLEPSAGLASGVIRRTTEVLLRVGGPPRIVTGSRVEFALNALMIVPLTLLTALLWPHWSWERWTAYAFLSSSSVELFQGLFLPDRSAQFADVVANTLGALGGALLAQVALRMSAAPAGVPRSDAEHH